MFCTQRACVCVCISQMCRITVYFSLYCEVTSVLVLELRYRLWLGILETGKRGMNALHESPDMITSLGVHCVFLCGLSNTVCFGMAFVHMAACLLFA